MGRGSRSTRDSILSVPLHHIFPSFTLIILLEKKVHEQLIVYEQISSTGERIVSFPSRKKKIAQAEKKNLSTRKVMASPGGWIFVSSSINRQIRSNRRTKEGGGKFSMTKGTTKRDCSRLFYDSPKSKPSFPSSRATLPNSNFKTEQNFKFNRPVSKRIISRIVQEISRSFSIPNPDTIYHVVLRILSRLLKKVWPTSLSINQQDFSLAD